MQKVVFFATWKEMYSDLKKTQTNGTNHKSNKYFAKCKRGGVNVFSTLHLVMDILQNSLGERRTVRRSPREFLF